MSNNNYWLVIIVSKTIRLSAGDCAVPRDLIFGAGHNLVGWTDAFFAQQKVIDRFVDSTEKVVFVVLSYHDT